MCSQLPDLKLKLNLESPAGARYQQVYKKKKNTAFQINKVNKNVANFSIIITYNSSFSLSKNIYINMHNLFFFIRVTFITILTCL